LYYSKRKGSTVLQYLSKVFITPDVTIEGRESNTALRNQLAKDGKKYKIIKMAR